MTNADATRVIVRMDLANGSFDTSTRIPTTEAFFNSSPTATTGSNIRGAYTFDGTSYYVAGISSTAGGNPPSGTRYITHGANGGSVRIQSTVAFANNVDAANGELYYSRYSTNGGNVWITQVPRDGDGNLPTTEGGMGHATTGQNHLVNETTVGPIFGFQFADGGDTLFTAGDGGLNVWLLVEGNYELQNSVGITGPGIAQLTVAAADDGTGLFYTGDDDLFYTVWNGSTFTSPELLLATGDDYAFRGLAVVPEPAAAASLLGLIALASALTRRRQRLG